MGRFVLGQGDGACRALQWQDESRRYVCGMATNPADYLRWLPQFLSPWTRRWFARQIAAGKGCDMDAELIDAGN